MSVKFSSTCELSQNVNNLLSVGCELSPSTQIKKKEKKLHVELVDKTCNPSFPEKNKTQRKSKTGASSFALQKPGKFCLELQGVLRSTQTETKP